MTSISSQLSSLGSPVLVHLKAASQQFLSTLAYYLGVTGRALYVEPGVLLEDAIASAKSLNEVQLIVLSQMRSLSKPRLAYPNEVWFSVLLEKADTDRIRGHLNWALSQTLEELKAMGLPAPSGGITFDM